MCYVMKNNEKNFPFYCSSLLFNTHFWKSIQLEKEHCEYYWWNIFAVVLNLIKKIDFPDLKYRYYSYDRHLLLQESIQKLGSEFSPMIRSLWSKYIFYFYIGSSTILYFAKDGQIYVRWESYIEYLRWRHYSVLR